MRNIVICFVLVFFGATTCGAQSNAEPAIMFECVSPVEVIKGAGCYLFDTGERVVRGVGDIVTAPFKAKLCIPDRKRYIYTPPKWTPGSLKLYPKKEAAPIPPHIEMVPDVKRLEIKPQKFYHPLYYPPKNNDRVAYRETPHKHVLMHKRQYPSVGFLQYK